MKAPTINQHEMIIDIENKPFGCVSMVYVCVFDPSNFTKVKDFYYFPEICTDKVSPQFTDKVCLNSLYTGYRYSYQRFDEGSTKTTPKAAIQCNISYWVERFNVSDVYYTGLGLVADEDTKSQLIIDYVDMIAFDKNARFHNGLHQILKNHNLTIPPYFVIYSPSQLIDFFRAIQGRQKPTRKEQSAADKEWNDYLKEMGENA